MKTLVLCIDRDNDVGEKVNVKGPIIGVAENIKVASNMALVDPEDTDINAIFGAVKIAKELNTEIVTLTGDRNVGIISDEEISRQLDKVIEKFKPESVILVADGTEDEQIIPIVQSRIKINSVRTIIVRQSKELEKAYFKILNFIKEIEKDSNTARLVFGIPGLVLILIAVGSVFGIGRYAFDFILVVTGIYLVLKGFGYEEAFFSRISDMMNSLSAKSIIALTYFLALLIFIIGITSLYDEYVRAGPMGFADAVLTFSLADSANIILLAGVIAIIGRIFDDYASERYLNIRIELILLAFLLLIKIVTESGANYWLEGNPLSSFIQSVIIGITIFIVVIKFTEYMFINEIRNRQKLISDFSNCVVYTSDGKKIGRVSKVLLNGSVFSGLKIGRKRIPSENIISVKDKTVLISQDSSGTGIG